MNSKGGFVRTEESARADLDALRLRSRGMTYREIADALGIDRSTAYRRVQRALDEIVADEVESHRALESARLDELQAALWEKALDGNLPAVDRVLAIMNRRARLLGLDAPTKSQVAISDFSADEISREIERLEKKLQETPSLMPEDGDFDTFRVNLALHDRLERDRTGD